MWYYYVAQGAPERARLGASQGCVHVLLSAHRYYYLYIYIYIYISVPMGDPSIVTSKGEPSARPEPILVVWV